MQECVRYLSVCHWPISYTSLLPSHQQCHRLWRSTECVSTKIYSTIHSSWIVVSPVEGVCQREEPPLPLMPAPGNDCRMVISLQGEIVSHMMFVQSEHTL